MSTSPPSAEHARDDRPEARLLLATQIEQSAPLEGLLIRRYKRFLADIELADGSELTVHCPNPGSMLGLKTPGARVRCSVHDNPKRKLKHTLEMIRVGRCWVGLHAAKANAIAEQALRAGAYSPFAGYDQVEREVKAPEGSRFDFRLTAGAGAGAGAGAKTEGAAACWVEVKSVTLCDSGAARFPDAVTKRGARHLEHLCERVRAGERAALLYIAQRSDAASVAPADDIDPVYGAALRDAAAAGVEIHALGADLGPEKVVLDRVLPVLL